MCRVASARPKCTHVFADLATNLSLVSGLSPNGTSASKRSCMYHVGTAVSVRPTFNTVRFGKFPSLIWDSSSVSKLSPSIACFFISILSPSGLGRPHARFMRLIASADIFLFFVNLQGCNLCFLSDCQSNFAHSPGALFWVHCASVGRMRRMLRHACSQSLVCCTTSLLRDQKANDAGQKQWTNASISSNAAISKSQSDDSPLPSVDGLHSQA